ncbi:MAG: di-trans,poly-cis-decaprenylcistransferase [Planctomycetes bacterium]|jgi:undecaprenyl diphosphate synthase|nr:di-trans,poly-cis-decaprenylcistransferase [Planctomycetota bacterium]MDP6408722.1 isoprenyl transferase [Planctomycetota bacterium]
MASNPPSPVERPDLGGPFPEHLAVIMDGNGRWAQRQGLRRIFGHREGIASVREVTTSCARMGLESLTLYAFSVENWKRPRKEVEYLMRLLRRYLVAERDTLMENGVRLMGIGRLDELPADALSKLRETEELTRENTGMVLRLALSYGSRTELADALREAVADAAAGNLRPDDVDDDTLRGYLYDPQTPDPDLVIRTAGEMRLSNFLLWQASYSELYVTEVCWPEFREPDLLAALRAYAGRERRYGGLIDAKPPDRGSEKAV